MQPSEPSKFAQAGGSPLDALDCPLLTLEHDGARIDLHGRRHPAGEDHTLGHVIDMDPHWNALSQAHPSEDRIYRRQPLPVGLCVRDVDAAGDAPYMAANNLGIAHQLDTRRVAYLDPVEIGLLEIAVDPE